MANEQLKLYPQIEPYDQGFMSVEGHEIYYEQCGNPDGKPAVFHPDFHIAHNIFHVLQQT